jgi:hypothetical protein
VKRPQYLLAREHGYTFKQRQGASTANVTDPSGVVHRVSATLTREAIPSIILALNKKAKQ